MAFFDFSTEPHRVDQFQIDGFAAGKLLLQKCAKCNHIQEPPRPMCAECHSLEFEAIESPGRGFLYSWVIPRHGAPEGETHIIGVVELDEGVRFVAEIVDTPLEAVENSIVIEAVVRSDDVANPLAFRRIGGRPETEPVSKVSHKPFHLRPRHGDNLWSKTAIAGAGHTEFSKNSGRTEMQLAAEASWAAIQDAGLEPSDIDGLITTTVDTNPEPVLMECLGINDITWLGRPPGGGNVTCAVIGMAAAAVLSGAARAVLVYRAFNERSGRRFGQPLNPLKAEEGVAARRRLNTPSSMYALWFQRYMYEYDVTNEDLGRYSVVARKHAANNPNAWFYNRPITLEDHQSSRWIVEPILRLLDCCQESDGGVAFVVTSREQARGGPSAPVVIEAAAQSHAGGVMSGVGYTRSNMGRFDEAAAVAAQLYEDTGLTPDDIDTATIYENFTPAIHLQLEAYRFCGLGQAKNFIAEGNIEIGGKLPVNTNGGLLGEAYIHGFNNILESVRQIRGSSYNQVPDAEHAVVSAGSSGLILGRD